MSRVYRIISLIISVAGYALVFALIAFFGARIIRPISDSYEKQKRFITDAGHEIKTPLTIISAAADVLEMDIGKNEWLTDIKKQTAQLSSLTDDLVYLARMEEADSALYMVEFPLSDVVSEATDSFLAPAQVMNKTLRCEISPMLSLKGDEKAMRQLVGILLGNALKYSPENSEILIKLERVASSVRLSVYNKSAAPLPKGSLPQLFERFYRVDASRNSATGGHGIGLSVACAIVEAHGGKIQASSADGQSLLITVTLPA